MTVFKAIREDMSQREEIGKGGGDEPHKPQPTHFLPLRESVGWEIGTKAKGRIRGVGEEKSGEMKA